MVISYLGSSVKGLFWALISDFCKNLISYKGEPGVWKSERLLEIPRETQGWYDCCKEKLKEKLR